MVLVTGDGLGKNQNGELVIRGFVEEAGRYINQEEHIG